MITLKLTDEQALGLYAILQHGVATKTLDIMGIEKVNNTLEEYFGDVMLSHDVHSIMIANDLTKIVLPKLPKELDCR